MAKGVLLRFLRRKVTAECQRGFGRCVWNNLEEVAISLI